MISGELVADRADILVAATNSVSRVVPPEWLKPGMHVTCVKITELGEETFRKVDRLVIHARKWAPGQLHRRLSTMRKSKRMIRSIY